MRAVIWHVFAAVITALSVGAASADSSSTSEYKSVLDFVGWCKYQWDDTKPVPPRLNLPIWACEVAEKRKLHARYVPYTQINPFFLTGDFNGDGKLDIAIWVQETQSRKLGIVIIHGTTGRVFTLWAGNAFGERGDDIRGLDQWTIASRGELLDSHWEDHTVRLRGDAPVLIKSESSAFALYWDGKKYATYQLTD